MSKNLFNLTALLLIIIILSSGCRKIFQIEGNYYLVKQERIIPPFNSVSVEGSLDVFIQHTNDDNIVVEAESNLIPYIRTEVKNNCLIIKEA